MSIDAESEGLNCCSCVSDDASEELTGWVDGRESDVDEGERGGRDIVGGEGTSLVEEGVEGGERGGERRGGRGMGEEGKFRVRVRCPSG